MLRQFTFFTHMHFITYTFTTEIQPLLLFLRLLQVLSHDQLRWNTNCCSYFAGRYLSFQ
jgi:hypothetical protein